MLAPYSLSVPHAAAAGELEAGGERQVEGNDEIHSSDTARIIVRLGLLAKQISGSGSRSIRRHGLISFCPAY